jgi:rubrerythrin
MLGMSCSEGTKSGGTYMEKKDFSAIIDLAVAKEEEAYDFYIGLVSTVENKGTKDTLQLIAAEEKKHKEFLINYRESGYGSEGLALSAVVDYKIAEHLEAPEPTSDMADKDVYLIAAHREKNAHEFYLSLAAIHPDGKAKNVLLKMAEEELKHKEKMEYHYSNAAFPQTSGG